MLLSCPSWGLQALGQEVLHLPPALSQGCMPYLCTSPSPAPAGLGVVPCWGGRGGRVPRGTLGSEQSWGVAGREQSCPLIQMFPRSSYSTPDI